MRHHSSEHERALLVVVYTDLRKGLSKHFYGISPRRIGDIAHRYGDVVRSFVYADSSAADDVRFRNEWEGAGFRLCHVLRNRVRVDRRITVIRAPSIQSSMPLHVLEDVAWCAARVVVLVATHEIPPFLFAALRGLGVKTVVLAPDPEARIRRLADTSVFLRDVARDDGRTQPDDAVAPVIGRYAAAPEFSRRPTDATERLSRDDPETAVLLSRILDATQMTKGVVLPKLRSLAEAGILPRIILAALLLLEIGPHDPDNDRHLDKDAFYRRLLALGIDIDAVGRFALDLLVERHVLAAMAFSEHDVEYQFTRDPDHPAHALARDYFGTEADTPSTDRVSACRSVATDLPTQKRESA